jgi:DNA-binding response OmpR family regulator
MMNTRQTNEFKPYILVVDDEPINRFVVEDLIEDRYELKLLEHGQDCLDSVNERHPDLILLDVNMPVMNGFDVCRRLKERPRTVDIPIIFLTAKISIEDERVGLELGAVDYITKPFTESILLARIKTHLSLHQTQKLLEQSYAKLKKERDYIEYIMLSMRDDYRFVDEQLKTLIAPVEKSNGDLILSASAKIGHRHILLGDFTGHGLSAAVAGPLVSSLFYSQAEQGIALKETAARINHELYQKLPPEIFMAAILIDWDLEQNQLQVWNCGMPSLLQYRNNHYLQSYKSSGLALGVVECFYGGTKPQLIEASAGDVFFGYSDGVLDVQSESNTRFGEQRVRELLEVLLTQGLPLEHILVVLEAYAGELTIQDDATLMQLQIP